MAIDEETLARIRDLLDGSPRVAADRIAVDRAGSDVVLRGAVATPEEATAAALLAEQEAPAVRNELQVDVNLREDAARVGASGTPSGHGDPDAAAREAASSDTFSPDQRSNQTGSAALDDPASDRPVDVEAAVGENLAWDPPDEPSLAPTAGEQRGTTDRDVGELAPADEGPVEDADDVTGGEEPSAADLSAAELAETARRRDRGGEG